MAPTALKKKKTFPPLPEALRSIHKQIELSAELPDQLLSTLNLAISTPWPYEKGDLCQWAKVLDVLDKQLGLETSSNELLAAVLRFARILLENCSNRHIYNSYEHLKKRLQSDDCDVVMGVLRVLSVLATPRSTRQMVCQPEFTSGLSVLASGAADGSGEHISLLKHCRADVNDLMDIGTRVTLQLYRTNLERKGTDGARLEGLERIRLTSVHTMQGSEDEIMQKLVEEHQIPEKYRFLLRLRLRLARVFPDNEKRLQWVRVKIMSTTVLAQCQGAFGNSPATTSLTTDAQVSELLELLQPPPTDFVPLELQTLALKGLTALLTERSKQSSLLASAASHQGILSVMIRRMRILVSDPHADNMPDRLRFGEALLAFTWMFTGSASGSAALSNAGIMHLLVPVLKDDASWSNFRGKFLTLAVKTLEVLMNFSQDMATAFRDMEGIDVLINRAYDEVRALKPEDTVMSDTGTANSDTHSGVAAPSQNTPLSPDVDALERKSERVRLLGAILNLLSCAASPLASPSEIRDLMTGSQLPHILTTIFENGQHFSSAIFEKAACMLTEFVHNEPGCLQAVLSTGISLTFLNAIKTNLPISRGVVTAVPSVLGALCLSSAGSQSIEAAQPIPKFMSTLCAEDVVVHLQGDCPSNLGVQLEELMRHNPSLLDSCMSGCVGIAQQIPGNLDALASKESQVKQGSAEDPARLSPQTYVTLVCEFLGKLLEPLMATAEHARAFVRKDGALALLQILARPEIPAEFSRSDAGRFIIVVLGKSAFLSPPSVLGEVMRRTNRCLAELRSLSSSETTDKSSECDQEKNKKPALLVQLDLLVNILCGIVGHFRGSTTATEWNNREGSELIDSLCKFYLEACSDGSLAAHQKQAPAPVEKSSEMEVEATTGEPVPQALSEAMNSLPVPTVSSSADDSTNPILNAITTLISRLSNSLIMISRRRPDTFDNSAQTHEKALSKMLAKYLARLIKIESEENEPSRLSAKFKKRIQNITVCLFGDESHRNTSRVNVNMVLLQSFEDEGGFNNLADTVAWFLRGVQDASEPEPEKPSNALLGSEIVERCIQLGIRIMTTPLTTMDRTGQQVTPQGFDKVKFLNSLKCKFFEAISVLWKDYPSFKWPTTVITPVFELIVQLLKRDTGNAPATGQASQVPPRRQVSYDPQTVTALMEMGFDERRVHTALDAIGLNSVELATEWLFLHSLPEEEDEESEIAQAMALSLQGQSSQDSNKNEEAPVPEDPAPETPEQVVERTRADQIEFLRKNSLQWSIKLLRTKETVDFAITDVLTAICKFDKEDCENVVMGLKEALSEEMASADRSNLSQILHTVAILQNESPDICSQALGSGFLQKLASLLIELDQGEGDIAEVPKWVSVALLALHSLMLLDDDTRAISTFKDQMSQSEADPMDDTAVNEGHLTAESRAALIRVAVKILKKEVTASLLQAVLQVVGRITKQHKDAILFLQEGGLQQILTSSNNVTFAGHAMIVGMIVHHLLEDSLTLQSSMQHEIRTMLSVIGRTTSVKNFLGSVWPLMQREPVVFVRAVRNCCQVVQEGGRQVVRSLDQKGGEKTVTGEPAPDQAEPAKIRAQSKATSLECMTKIVNSLVTRLVSRYRQLPAQDGDAMDVDGVDAKPSPAISVAHLLRYLAENVRAYPGCAVHLAKYTLGTESEAMCDENAKKPDTFLQFLIKEVLPGDLPKHRAASSLADGAINRRSSALLLAMLPKGIEVRRKVLSEIVTALNSPPTQQMTSYLLMLQSLGDVLYSFLTVRAQYNSSRQPSPDTVRLATEAKLPQAVCFALGCIDLHHPLACKVSTALLRPLDVLCAWALPVADGADGSGREGTRRQDEAGADGGEGGDFIESNTYSVLADEDEPENPLYSEGPEVDLEFVHEENEDEDSDPDLEDPEDSEHNEDEDEDEDDDEDDEDEDDEDDEDASDADRDTQEEEERQLQDEAREFLDEEYDDMMPEMYVDTELRMGDEHLDEDARHVMGQEFQSLFERVLENQTPPFSFADEIELMQRGDLEIETDGRQQVLSLVLPPERGGMADVSFLHNYTANADMPVIRFPGQSIGGMGERAGPAGNRQASAIQDEPMSQHPLLSRRQEAPRPRPRNMPDPTAALGYVHPEFANMLAQDLWEGLAPVVPPPRMSGMPDRHVEEQRGNGLSDRNRRWNDIGVVNPRTNARVEELEQCLITGLSALATRSDEGESIEIPVQQPAPTSAPLPSAEAGIDNPTNGQPTPSAEEASSSAPPSAAETVSSTPVGEDAAGANELQPLSSGQEGAGAGMLPDAAGADDAQARKLPESILESSIESQDTQDSGGAFEEPEDPMAEEAGVEEDEEDDLEAALRLSMENVSNLNEAEDLNAAVPAPAEADEEPEQEAMEVAEEAPESGPDPALAQPSATGEAQVDHAQTESSPSIDPAFLAEIPPELRAEVLAQQERQAAAAQLANTAIDPDFLAALPPDIQADVIRQHQREEQERRRQQEQAARPEEPADISRSEDMDNASFLATLSQELREEVLLTADEAFVASLPPHLAAEASILRDRAHGIGGARFQQQYMSSGMVRRQESGGRAFPDASAARQAAHPGSVNTERPRRQVIEEAHVESIIRLLFVAQPVHKSLMHKILVHLAAHAPTREASLKFLLAAALQEERKDSPMQIMYGADSSGFFMDGNSAMTVLKRSLEAISHMASQDNQVCKVLLKDGFFNSNGTTLEDSTAVLQASSPFHALLALLAGKYCCQNSALQEQLLQLLNFSLTAATAHVAEENAVARNVPHVSSQDLKCLTVAISNPQSSSKAMDRAINLLRSLSIDGANLMACTSHLVLEAEASAQKAAAGLKQFSPSSPSQGDSSPDLLLGEHDVRFLKILKILKSMWPTQAPEGMDESDSTFFSTGMVGAIKQDELWELLGQVLQACKSQKEGAVPTITSMSPVVSRLQPLVEAFLIVKAPSNKDAFAVSTTPTATSPGAKVEKSLAADGAAPAVGVSTSFFAFSEQHRDVLNMYIRQDKSLLGSMAFSPLVSMHKLLDFDNKKHYFRSELKKRNAHQRHGTIRLNVRRDFVFEDSFHQIMLRKSDELKGRLSVVFSGEEGIDAGGLTREWYLTLSKQMLNPDKALFIHAANGLNYQPNPASTIQPDHLKYFKFAGLVVGKALWDEQLLDAHFTLSMYKHMLNQPIEYKDVESIDPEYYRNLGWMLENDITDILEETFSVVREQFGVMLTIDLKPDGRNILVTNENKHEYVNLVAEQVMTKGIKEQVEAFKDGFHQMMPPDLISIFTSSELELLMCGLPSIDVDDLKANTEYTGYNRESKQIQWFWKLVMALNQEDLARLVQFVTGTSQVPMEGFKALKGMNGPQKFNIHRCGDASRLPSSHTCFNQLDLPEYSSEDMLNQRLLSAIREGFEGFGFS